MPRASETEIRCRKCFKLLAKSTRSVDIKIKCPRCHTLNTVSFPTEIKSDRQIITFLWRPDGHSASSISIDKEVWLNISGDWKHVPRGKQFMVFHVYNYLDPSKAHSPDSGCRINPLKEPFLTYEDALRVAIEMENEALASGKWVQVDYFDA